MTGQKMPRELEGRRLDAEQGRAHPAAMLMRFFMALSFLTRLPVPSPSVWPDNGLAGAMVFFPLAGACVGLAAAAAFWLGGWLWSPLTGAVLALIVPVLLTGGLHEDGLADCADGLGGGSDREKALAIMRDSRLGSYGALALFLMLALRLSLLALLPPEKSGLLVLVHGMGRAVLPWLMASLPPARPGGLGAGAGRPDPSVCWLALGQGAVVAFLLLPPGRAVLLLAVVALGCLALRRLALRRLGGFTGDVAGALEQVTEALVLLVCVAGLP